MDTYQNQLTESQKLSESETEFGAVERDIPSENFDVALQGQGSGEDE
jgi:hypothetical protein